jgi:hypothetical protein
LNHSPHPDSCNAAGRYGVGEGAVGECECGQWEPLAVGHCIAHHFTNVVHRIVKLPGIPFLKLIVNPFPIEFGSLVPISTTQVSSVTATEMHRLFLGECNLLLFMIGYVCDEGVWSLL